MLVLRLNVAPTETLEFRFIVQVLPVLEEQAPDQPAKVEPEAGEAVKVILVPETNFMLHMLPQLMPIGLLFMIPEPVPDLEIVMVFEVFGTDVEGDFGVAVGVDTGGDEGVIVGVGVVVGKSVGLGSGVSDGVIVGIVNPLLPG
jgi:hypothetical protein